MNFSKENYNASSAKNAPGISSPIDLNELPGSHITQNTDVLSFRSMVNQIDGNHEDGDARADHMPTVNMLDPPNLPYMIHNASGTLPKCHNTQTADLLRFRNMVNQIDENGSARADCTSTSSMLDPTVHPYKTLNTHGSLHSHNHFMMVDSDNAGTGTSLSNQTPQSDSSLLHVRGNTTAGVQISSQGGAGTSTHFTPDTLMADDINRPRMVRDLISVGTYMRAANQYYDNQLPVAGNACIGTSLSNQTPTSDRSLLCVRGNTPSGVQINSQDGAGTSTHSTTDTLMSDDINRPRMVRDLVSVGTYMHPANQYHDNRLPVAGNACTGTSLSNQTPRSDRSSVCVRGNTTAGVQINSQGGAGTSTHFTPDTLMTDDINRPQMARDLVSVGTYMHAANQYHDNRLPVAGNACTGTSLSNQTPKSDRSLLCVRGNRPAGVQKNSQGGAGTSTHSTPDSLMSDDIYRSRMVAANQYHHNRIPMAGNHVRNAVQSNYLGFPGTNLDHGIGGEMITPYPSNYQGGAGPHNNGKMVNPRSYSSHRPQADGSFLSLGRNMGDVNLPICNSRPMLGANAGTNSTSFSSFQTQQSDEHHCYPIQRSIIGVGGSADSRNGNVNPYGGYPGHSSMVPRHFNGIQATMLGNEQVRPVMIGQPSNIAAQVHNQLVPAQIRNQFVPAQQQYLNNLRTALNSSSMAPPFGGTTASTSSIDQSGKRGPTEGSEYAQPAKVQVVPSLPPGKPVPLAVWSGHKPGLSSTGSKLRRASPVLVRPPSSGGIPPASATSLRSQRTIPQVSNPYLSSANQNTAAYHLKCKFDEPIVSIGENCSICKRDLIFTPTGAVTQPSIPPPVAVLSCGHTFHDECLQNITPPEQAKNPPCIPCAIGKF